MHYTDSICQALSPKLYISTVVIPILQITKPRHRVVKYFAQNHTTLKWQICNLYLGNLALELMFIIILLCCLSARRIGFLQVHSWEGAFLTEKEAQVRAWSRKSREWRMNMSLAGISTLSSRCLWGRGWGGMVSNGAHGNKQMGYEGSHCHAKEVEKIL